MSLFLFSAKYNTLPFCFLTGLNYEVDVPKPVTNYISIAL